MSKISFLLPIVLMSLVSCSEGARRANISSYTKASKSTTCETGFTYDETQKKCIEDIKVVTRPNNAMRTSSFCACQNSLSITYNNDCASFCSNKSVTQKTLYVTYTPSTDVLLNTLLGNVKNWCEVALDANAAIPQCFLDVLDEDNNTVASVPANNTDLILSGNNIVANIDSLSDNQNFRLRLRESTSNSTSADYIQLRLFDPNDSNTPEQPLWTAPISQYTCLFREVDSPYIGYASRFYFYFNQHNTPPAIPIGINYLVCHNAGINTNDSPTLPRLELLPSVFRLWDDLDPRFADAKSNNSSANVNIANNVPDIIDEIYNRLLDRGATSYLSKITSSFFSKLSWANYPASILENNSNIPNPQSSLPVLGYVMQPFIDSNYMSYCPNNYYYYSTDPLMRVLKEIIGIETEGLYYASAETESYTASDGTIVYSQPSYMYINETTLKQIWFYVNSSNVAVAPTESTVRGKTVFFYWPANPAAPTTKNSTQKTYRIVVPSGTGVTPHDYRIGCVPKAM